MKIIIEHYDNIRSSEISEESTIDETMTEIERILYSTGYAIKSIEKWICERAYEIEQDKNS